MNKLILNFKSKDSKKIKNPKNFLGGKGANLSERWEEWVFQFHLDLQFQQTSVIFFTKIKRD